MKKTFTQWIKGQAGTTSYLDDVANDIQADANFPDTNDIGVIVAYLEGVGAFEGAIRHVEWAYTIYMELLQKGGGTT